MIEKTLERIADALELIANKMGGSAVITDAPSAAAVSTEAPAKPAKATTKAPKAAAAAPAAEVIDKDTVTAWLRKYVDPATGKGHEAAKALLKKFNATRISDIQEKDYAAIVAEMKAALPNAA